MSAAVDTGSDAGLRGRARLYLRFVTDTVGTALRSIWANRQRSFLTALGVITGCMAFTGSYGILWGKFENDLHELRRLGATYVSVSGAEALRQEHGVELAAQIPGITTFSPVFVARGKLATKLRSADADMVGVGTSFRGIFDLRVDSGRFFAEPEVRTAADVCIIGAGLARDLGLRPIGKESPHIEVLGQLFRVVGIMEPRQGAMAGCGEYDRCVIMPSTTLREARPEVPLAYLAFQAGNEGLVPTVVAAVRYRLRRMLGLSSFDRDSFQVHQAADVIDRIEKEVTRGGSLIMGIVCLTLLVGGIGVMNIMLVTVVERTPEIGLRKAVGARSSEILLQFLVESLCLCTAGGVAGTTLGVILAYALIDAVAPGVSPVLPPQLILISLAFAVATGLLFGFAPAVKASKLSPIEALRHD